MQKKVNELETPLGPEEEEIFKFLTAAHTMKATKDASVAAQLIREFKLVREHVPTWLHNAKEVGHFMSPIHKYTNPF
jgi:ABC-type Fe2+-enterobactin transport system substrate-binding protein